LGYFGVEMKQFYSSNIKGNNAVLEGKERDHCVRVLRTAIGDSVEVVDGLGNLYSGKLASTGKVIATIHFDESKQTFDRKVLPAIACAIPKNHTRWEWILEKAVEIGVNEIIPLIAHRSEKKHIRRERNEQIILSAFKQSGHYYLPKLKEPTKFKDLIVERSGIEGEHFIAYCGEVDKQFIGNLHESGKPSVVLIGPEGDFTAEEVSLATSAGFQVVSLGTSRLRVETAAIVACVAIHQKEEMI